MRPAKSTLIVFASSQLATVVGFIATFYIASQLGAEVLGAYSIVIGMLFWLHLPGSAIDSAITKRLSEGVDQGEILSAGVILNGGLSILVAGGVLLFAPYVDAYVGHAVSGAVAVLVFGWFASHLTASSLRGQKRVYQSSIVWTTGRILRTSLQIGLTFFAGLGLAGLIWGHTISFVVAAVLAYLLFAIGPAWPSINHFRQLIEFARYSWLGRMSGKAFNWMDTVILAFFVGAAQIGIYEVAWTMASTLAIISGAISETVFPDMSELDSHGKKREVEHLLREGLSFAGVFAIPGFFGAAVVGERVLRIYGPEYGAGATILLLLIVARIASAFGGQFKNTINAVDRPDIAFRINGIFLATNGVLNIVLIPLFGWYGAAIATASSAILSLLASAYAINKTLDLQIPFFDLGAQVLSSAVMVVAVVLMEGVLPRGAVGTVVIVLVAAAVYALVLSGISANVRNKLISIVRSR